MFKIAASKNTQLFLAGFSWICVGIMLLNYSRMWLSQENQAAIVYPITLGILGALIAHHFGFLRIVDKILGRLMKKEEKTCVFSFISWKSYITIVFMVAMGIGLKHSAIPKKYLSGLYITIGGALILSSTRYMRVLYQITRKQQGKPEGSVTTSS